MRINNPKTIVGFSRTDQDSKYTNTIDYNLATVGQVKAAIGDLRKTIIGILRGSAEAGEPGAAGIGENLSPVFGYAYLDAKGQVPTNLLPALAITDTNS